MVSIRIGDRVSGVVVRSLRASARSRVETFRAVIDGLEPEGRDLPGATDVVVGEFRFEGVAGDPLVLWDGSVPAASAEAARVFFDGNVDRYQAMRRVINATAARPLPDGEFWPIIDALGGRSWERTIRSAERLLAERGDHFAIRWAQTAGLKALGLADAFDAAGVPAVEQLDVIGATLAQGRDVYSVVRGDVTAFDRRWLADMSAQTIWMATGALERLGPRNGSVQVETAFSSRQQEILERTDVYFERWQREHDIRPEDPGPFFRVARAVMKLGEEYRERLFLLVDAQGVLEDPSSAIAVAEDFGGEIVAGLEFSTDGGLGGLFNSEIFTIKRRSTASATDYLAMHASMPD